LGVCMNTRNFPAAAQNIVQMSPADRAQER
jgi:hypothetical protein